MPDTHVVTNQVPLLLDYNPATSPVLLEALIREGGDGVSTRSPNWGPHRQRHRAALGRSRRPQRPILHTHDRYGYRVDEIEYDPAYHELMRAPRSPTVCTAPLGRRPARRPRRAGGQDERLDAQPGHVCPISMTYAVVPGAAAQPELAAVYEPLLTSRVYDPELGSRPPRPGSPPACR